MTLHVINDASSLRQWRRRLALRVSAAALLGVAGSVMGVAGTAAADTLPAPQQVAQATPSAGAADQLETIVVTDRYHAENLQQTPISISAVTAEDMEKKGYQTIDDLSKQVPNLKFDPGAGAFGNTATVFIRGIGQADFHPALDPGVGIYVDDIYYGSLYGDQFDLSDIDRVEVLRGPQGTLFGRNTEGGAIRIFTTQPKGDYSGYAEVGYGSYNQEQFKGAFDIPIIKDVLAMRISAGINDVDGYVNTVDFACANPAATAALNKKEAAGPFPYAPIRATTTAPGCVTGQMGGSDTGSYHGSLLFTPTDNFKLLLTGDLLDIKGEEPASVTTYINPNYPGSLGFLAAGYGPIFVSPNHYTNYSGTTDLLKGYNFPNENDTFSYGFGATATYTTPWGFDVKNIVGYRGFDDSFSVWLGGSPIALDNNLNQVTHRQLSEELQFTGETDALFGRKLEWAMGAYYYIGKTNYNSPIVDLPPFGLAFEGINPATDTNTSGFIHGVYHITDQFSTEVGVRYSTESKSFSFDSFDPAPGGYNRTCRTDTLADAAKCYIISTPGGQAFEGFGPNEGPFVSSSERFDPKVEFNYNWTPDVMTYWSVSTGYKGGGINPRPSNPSQLVTFKPEDLTATEIGEKSQWFDNKFRLNADFFVEDYKELQTPFVPAGSAGSIYINTGHVILYGTEVEATLQPMPGLQIDSQAGWLHNKTASLGAAGDCPTGGTVVAGCNLNGSLPGQKLPGIPSWKLSTGIQYAYDLPNDTGVFTPRIDWNYQSTVYYANQTTFVQSVATNGIITASQVPILGRQPGYSTFNAHLAYDSPDGNWTAAFEVRNLTNQFYYLNGFGLLSSYGNLDETPSLPRTYFFTVKRSFAPPEAPTTYTPPPAPAPVAEAPAAPAPAPEAQRSFQVFFDFDKSDITDAASRVIEAAATAVKQGNIVRIAVTGHTDTVGTAKYNQALSERRAAAVKASLVADGVAGNEITATGVGKTGLLVPTADGVREPQNRRAEIVLQ